MATKLNLTEAKVAKAHRDRGPATYTFDAQPGLSLNVGKTKSSWVLRKREGDTGRLVAITLGEYPGIDHNAVQALAANTRAGIEEVGRYVAPEKKAGVPTFGEAFERYCRRKNSTNKGLKPTTEADYRRQVFGTEQRKGNLHKLVDRPIDTISRDDLQRLFDSGEPFKDAKGHTATAQLCRRIIAFTFNDCDEVAHLRPPTAKLNMDPPRTRRTKDECEDDESTWQIGRLQDLWMDIESLRDDPRINPGLPNLWMFGLFTGIRMSAILSLTWDRVDLAERKIRLRAEDQKNGVARTLPLSDAAVDILLRQRPISTALGGNADLVFPSTRVNRKGTRRMYQVRRLDNGSFHSCRHHFSTAASNAGLSDYQWAFLRGDILHGLNSGQARMAKTYKHEATDEEANKVATEILKVTV